MVREATNSLPSPTSAMLLWTCCGLAVNGPPAAPHYLSIAPSGRDKRAVGCPILHAQQGCRQRRPNGPPAKLVHGTAAAHAPTHPPAQGKQEAAQGGAGAAGGGGAS